MLNRIKEKYNRYIQKLAEVNKEAFGNDKLDCCNMQKQEYRKRY
ncbi:MAG: LDCC motif putative metal-binding protein [Eubacteriales bacterium]